MIFILDYCICNYIVFFLATNESAQSRWIHRRIKRSKQKQKHLIMIQCQCKRKKCPTSPKSTFNWPHRLPCLPECRSMYGHFPYVVTFQFDYLFQWKFIDFSCIVFGCSLFIGHYSLGPELRCMCSRQKMFVTFESDTKATHITFSHQKFQLQFVFCD